MLTESHVCRAIALEREQTVYTHVMVKFPPLCMRSSLAHPLSSTLTRYHAVLGVSIPSKGQHRVTAIGPG